MSDVTDDPSFEWIEEGDLLAPDNGPIPAMQAEELATILEDMARWCRNGETAARMRHNARVIRGRAGVAPLRMVTLSVRHVAPKPRERREQRHVARTTSSADSGDPPLATCPVCSDLDLVRHLCTFCGGAGHVHRERRNAYKRGER
jgi:hypothetical protein